MHSEEEIFASQADLIKQASTLLNDRCEKINEIGKSLSASASSVAEEERDSAILIFKERSLRLYKGTLSYIAEELMNNATNKHFFLLPHLRTLLDVHARFLHLLINCASEDTQALTCIGYQLLTYSSLGNSSYQQTLPLYKNFLKQAGTVFPSNATEFDFRLLKKKGLIFASRKKLLTEENIKKYSTYTVDVFSKQKRIHWLYSQLSEILHGNPYYYKDSPHNERFWIVASSISTTAFLVELVDRTTLSQIQPRDFRIWLAEVEKSKGEFINLWKERRA